MTSKKAMRVLRMVCPAMRRTRSTAIIHSGQKRTLYGCVCGARHSCATDYRMAKHVEAWRKDHDGCAIELAEAVMAGQDVDVVLGTAAVPCLSPEDALDRTTD